MSCALSLRYLGDAMEKPYKFLYPMRIVLISCAHGGKDNWMAAAWCFPLSSEPPVFGVCIAKKRYSYELMHAGKEFAINIPGEDLKDAITKFGRTSGRNNETDKFALAHLTKERGTLSAPLIKECISSIECTVIEEKEIGDHILFIGKAKNIVKRREGKGLYHLGGDEIKAI